MNFEILGEITNIEIIAIDNSIRRRKLKGNATIQLADGTICEAEIHRFESHHAGKKDLKIKRLLK
ncbi:MAG: hypothetical protein OHK0052_24010 [Anaerolineales bacterium]